MHDKELKSIFYDIINGFTRLKSPQFGTVYIKHFNNFDLFSIDQKYLEFLQVAESQGVPNYGTQNKYVMEQNLWTEKEEIDLNEQIICAANMKKGRDKTFIPSHIEQMNKQIKETEAIIESIKNKKENIIGITTDKYAARKINQYYVFFGAYKDINNNTKLFKEEEFTELDDEQLNILYKLYEDFGRNFNTLNFKRISISNFFVNSFYLSDNNAYEFYGKPIIQLTLYQTELFHHATYFKHILTETKEEITDEILENPDLLVDAYNAKKSMDEMSRKTGKVSGEGGATSYLGANKQDIQKMKLGPTLNEKFRKASLKKGGSLTAQELLDIEDGKSTYL